jgi:hypothetical protein
MVSLKIFYVEKIATNEYFNYSFIHNNHICVFIGDYSLNSLEKIESVELKQSNSHGIEMVNETSDIKLPEPFNQCKESLVDEPYHRCNCINKCIFREIATK